MLKMENIQMEDEAYGNEEELWREGGFGTSHLLVHPSFTPVSILTSPSLDCRKVRTRKPRLTMIDKDPDLGMMVKALH